MALASAIMDAAASLLNDTAKSTFTYAAQMPYLNMALGELRESMELAGIPASNETSAGIAVPAGSTTIGATTGPALPADLIEIQELSERQFGTTDQYVAMTRVAFLPNWVVPIQFLVYWSWQGQIIELIGATSNIEVRIKYIAAKIPPVTASSDPITLFNCESFLEYKTAELCAMFIGENPTRAQVLNGKAVEAIDRFLGISTKGQQSIFTRRRPFRAGYRNRGYY